MSLAGDGGLEVDLCIEGPRGGVDVSFRSEAAMVGLFGPSGAGKTSVLEAVAGLRPRARGRVRLGDRVLMDSELGVRLPPERREVGYLPQDLLLFPHLDVAGNVASSGRPGGEPTARVLDVLGLSAMERRAVGTLSGGERQRVALARALCSRPRLLLLDEPLGALDLPLRRRVLPYLMRVRDLYRIPTLLVSHDAAEVQALCDEVVVLKEGRVVAQGPPAEVLPSERVYALADARGYENVLEGRLVATGDGVARLRVKAGVELAVPPVEATGVGARVVVAVRAEDLLVATGPTPGLSARNRIPARIGRLRVAGGAVLLEASLGEGDGPRVAVKLTAEAVRDLGLEAGRAVYLVAKSSSFRILAVEEAP
ncbi:MAG: TOBE-like domain-containing protein [Planctomycetes bacterium]|nr:TOBE-like domain-containing protein [Planctomycetota bacterium]